jgi:SAM-dependent methyltransferase
MAPGRGALEKMKRQLTITSRFQFRLHTVSCVICGSHEFSPRARGMDDEYHTSNQWFSFVSCNQCGHEYLNPRPVDEDLPMAYPDTYYTCEGRHTARKSILISTLKSFVIGRRLRDVRDLFERGGRVLEIGCGDGSLLLDLKNRYPGLELTGMDFSVGQDVKTRFDREGISLIIGRVEEANLEPENYDLIIMNQLIEHLTDPPAVLEKLARSLAPGGRMSIETPNRKGYDRRFFRSSCWGGYYFPRHLHLFDDHSLKALLENKGLVVDRHAYLLAPIIWIFSVHAVLSRKTKGRLMSSTTRFFTDRNPLCLAFFTLIDLVARFAGFPTSNQKFIVRK